MRLLMYNRKTGARLEKDICDIVISEGTCKYWDYGEPEDEQKMSVLGSIKDLNIQIIDM